MRTSPLLSAAAAAALVAGLAGPASAATPASPASGRATSGATLLTLGAAGHELSAGTLQLISDTLSGSPLAEVVLTPLELDGTAYGQQRVTPGADGTAPALESATLPGALAGALAVRSPALSATASDTDGTAATEAGAGSLGGVSLLGLPVDLSGSLTAGSLVSPDLGAADQSVLVEDLALPSIAELLGALGLDVSKVPVEVLLELVQELDLVNTAVDDAQDALADATAEATALVQAQLDAVDAATAALAAEQQQLAALEAAAPDLTAARAAAEAQLAQAQASQASAAAAATTAAQSAAALQAVYDATPTLLQPPLLPALTAAQAAADEAADLAVAATAAVDAATAQLAAADSLEELRAAALTAADAAVDLAEEALAAANRLLDAAQQALTDLLATLAPLVATLLETLTDVLDGTPLVSLDSLQVLSSAGATSAEDGGQSAEVVGGEVTGLRVLGTDVLDSVLGTSSVELLDVTAAQLAAVNGLIADLTGTLSDVLSSVPGLPTLAVPAPTVELLTQNVDTGTDGRFGTAATELTALSITLPSISVPTALAVSDAAGLPALAGVTQDVAGVLSSGAVTMELANLGNAVRFAPAAAATGTPTTGTPTTGTPTTGTPTAGTPRTLPTTGADAALAGLGVALLAAAAVVTRRRRALAEV